MKKGETDTESYSNSFPEKNALLKFLGKTYLVLFPGNWSG